MDGFLPTFKRRGLLPPRDPKLSLEAPSTRTAIPERVIIPLQDVPDTPYEISVRVGEYVLAGQKIGHMGTSPVGHSVHATTSGTIEQIGPLPHPLGFPAPSVVISADGKDAHAEHAPLHALEQGLPGEKAASLLQEAGIPFNYLLLSRNGYKFPWLIINATEFEPTITSKHLLLKECAPEVAKGLSILCKVFSIQQALIIIERGQDALLNVIRHYFHDSPAVIKEVPIPYPDTATDLLAKKASGGLFRKGRGHMVADFMAVDIFCLYALYIAAARGVPFLERLVTISGSGVKEQQNTWVKVGTPLEHLILHAGGSPQRIGRLIMGGPLMGIPQRSLAVPLLKKTNGVFATTAFLFDEHRQSRFYKKTSCVRCAKCVDVCPAGIVPASIVALIENKRMAEAEPLGIFRCLECGLCDYACPSRIPLLEFLRLGKVSLKGEQSLLVRSALASTN